MPSSRLDRLFARLQLVPVELIAVSPRSNVFLAAPSLAGPSLGAAGGVPGAADRVVVKVRFAEPSPAPPGADRHAGSRAEVRSDERGGRDVDERRNDLLDREREVLRRRPIAAMPRLLHHDAGRSARSALVMAACPGRPLAAVRALTPEAAERAAVRLRGHLAGLHAAGIAHGGLDDRALVVGTDGSVTLLGFGRACFAGEPAFDSLCAADRATAAVLAERLLEVGRSPRASLAPTPPPRTSPVLPASRRASPAYAVPSRPSRVVAVPSGSSPVVAVPSGSSPVVAVPSRPSSALPGQSRVAPVLTGPSVAVARSDWAVTADRVGTAVTEPRLVEVLDPALAAVAEGARGVRAWVRRAARTRRARAVLLAIVAAVIMAGVAATLLPRSDDGDSATTAPPTKTAPTTTSATGLPGAEPSREASPQPGSSRSGSSAAGGDAALRSEDPVIAGAALLEARRECFVAGELECLTALEQWGSPAWRDDRAAMADDRSRTEEAHSAVPVMHLVQLYGGVALLGADAGNGGETQPESGVKPRGGGAGAAETAPASLLVVRGEAGWRIRRWDPGE